MIFINKRFLVIYGYLIKIEIEMLFEIWIFSDFMNLEKIFGNLDNYLS